MNCFFFALCRTYQQRLKSCDDAFREQLEAKQRSHDSHMTKILAEKEQEIQQANQKVYELTISLACITSVSATFV